MRKNICYIYILQLPLSLIGSEKNNKKKTKKLNLAAPTSQNVLAFQNAKSWRKS